MSLTLSVLALWVTSAASAGTAFWIRGQEAIGGAMPVAVGIGLSLFSACIGLSLSFWLSTGALVILDVLFSGSRRARRLVELSALACWPQVVWGLMGTIGVWLWFSPEPFEPLGGSTTLEAQRLMDNYQDGIASSPFILTYNVLGAFVSLWVVGLQVCALRVVSGFTVRATWGAAVLLGGVLVVVPWAIQRF